ATPWVRQDIVERLGLRDPDIVVTGVDRPNLYLEVVRVDRRSEHQRVLEELLVSPSEAAACVGLDLDHRIAATRNGSGIVYTGTTRAAEETVSWLRGWGIAADAYHGRRTKR